VDVLPEEPTSESVLRALAGRELRGVTVAIQLAGDDSPALVERLRRRGATVLPVQLYEWVLPDDQAPLERAVREIAAGRVHAVAFTSAPQVRQLWLVAGRLGLAERLAEALRGPVAAAVVGPVCRAALVERGVTPRVEPRKSVMGALVHAIAEHLAASRVDAGGPLPAVR
jgi:uroporphyrinogen-III synthase